MTSWASFYRELANEANERAVEATTPSVKHKFEEVAKEQARACPHAVTHLRQQSSVALQFSRQLSIEVQRKRPPDGRPKVLGVG